MPQQTYQNSRWIFYAQNVLAKWPYALRRSFQVLEQANIKGKLLQLHSITLAWENASLIPKSNSQQLLYIATL
jgi:hypothetical protein